MVDQVITLTVTATDAPADQSTLLYEWDLDYNQISFISHLTGTSVTVSWPISNTYHIALRVRDKDGGQALETKMIRVVDSVPNHQRYSVYLPVTIK